MASLTKLRSRTSGLSWEHHAPHSSTKSARQDLLNQRDSGASVNLKLRFARCLYVENPPDLKELKVIYGIVVVLHGRNFFGESSHDFFECAQT